MAFVKGELNPVVGKSRSVLWTYENSAVDSLATQRGAGWFAGAAARGMKVGDHIISSDTAGIGGVLRADAIVSTVDITAT